MKPLARADLMLNVIRSARVIAFDVETNGIDPYACQPIGYVVTDACRSLYVPVRHTGGGNAFPDPLPFEREMRRAFALRSRLGLRTVMHNAAFDLWMAARRGIVLGPPLEDTMINAVLLDDSDTYYTLAACADRLEVTPKKGAELYAKLALFGRKGEKDLMKYFHRLAGDDPLAVEYAEGDGTTTYELWEAQQPLLAERGLSRVHDLECRLIPHLAALRRRGIRIDTRYGEEATARLREELAKLRLHFPKGFAPNKKSDVLPWLKAQGIASFPLTRTGQEATDRKFLETLGDIGERIIELRELEKIEQAFIEPLLTTHLRHGRIHPELVQSRNDNGRGTHTGRFSCVNPNLQQYPKRNEKLGKIVRPLIMPDPGFILAESDVSQQEPRLYAHYSREPSLLEGYNATPYTDIHTTTAKLLGIDRGTAKTLGLSLFNGMQAPSLAARMKISIGAAEGYIRDFFKAYPKIEAFTVLAPQGAYKHGFIKTVLGRKCHLSASECRMAVSRIIQGSAADQMKLLLLRGCEYAGAYPDKMHILMNIHDSLLWQVRQGFDTTEFLRVLDDNSAFCQVIDGVAIPMRVPFPMETRFGRNWSEASYGK